MNSFQLNNGIDKFLKKEWAKAGFLHTSTYDKHIYNYLNDSVDESLSGMNRSNTGICEFKQRIFYIKWHLRIYKCLGLFTWMVNGV